MSAGHALANFLLAVEFAEVREEFVAVDVVSAIDLRMPDGKGLIVGFMGSAMFTVNSVKE
ncbi:hypothetical protein [Caballeronia sp. AZ1_KS37]|uniref:hypothetical protein n=1 Tax=Caballeronia sp. AZ1_KS37 TaxID=2921756 RepID=UPI0020287421|nr:hypothetical protein [Caballeronia sp. AZ1_KS37]